MSQSATSYQKITRQYGNSDISPQIKFKWILLLGRSITVKEKEKKKITQTWVAALIIWLFYCIIKDQNDR